MRGLISLIVGFFRLGPFGLVVVAMLVLGAGFGMQVMENRAAAERAAVLALPPPGAVAAQDHDPVRHARPMSEATLQGQLDFSMDYQLTLEKRGTDSLAYMIPIYSTDAVDLSGPALGVVLYDGAGFAFDEVDAAELVATSMVGAGPVGPILELNGRLGSPGEMGDLIRGAFDEQGRSLVADPLILLPWRGGREAALAPPAEDALGPFDVAKWIAAAIALMALVKLAIRSDRPASAAPAEAPVSAATMADGDVPEWQRRSMAKSGPDGARPTPGLEPVAQEIAPVPAMPEEELPEWKRRLLEKGAYVSGSEAMAEPAPATLGDRLRRVALVVVGSLFALSLVLTLVSLFANAPAPVEGEGDDGFSITRLLRATQLAITEPRDMADLPDSALGALAALEFDVGEASPWLDLDAAVILGLLTEDDLATPQTAIAAIQAKVPNGMDGIRPEVAAALRQAADLPEPEGTAPAVAPAAPEAPVEAAPPVEGNGKDWLQIDLQPMIDWVIDTAFLALTGDRAAQIKIGLMVGGFFAAIMSVYVLSILRAVMSPSRRRKVHSFSDMGVN